MKPRFLVPRLKTVVFILVSVLAPFLVSGCTSPPVSRFRLGTNVWPGYEPLYLGRALGFLDEKEIALVEYSSASEVLRSFRNGVLEGAALTLDEFFMLRDQGLDVVAVLVFDQSQGADVVVAQPEFTSMKDLKGKKVGFEDNALGGFMLARALGKSGLKKEDVSLVSLQVDQQEAAFLNKEVDAVVTFEPTKTRLVKQGAAVVFDSSRIPGEIVDVLVVRREILQSHPDTLRHLGEGWFRSLRFLKKEPQKSAKVMSSRLNLPPGEVESTFQGILLGDEDMNLGLLGENSKAGLALTSHHMVRFMVEQGLIKNSVETSKLTHPIIVAGLE